MSFSPYYHHHHHLQYYSIANINFKLPYASSVIQVWVAASECMMIWRPSWLRNILSAIRAGERSGSATWPTTGCCWKDSRLDDGRKHRRRTPLSPTVRYKDCVYAWYPSMYVCSVQCVLIDKYIVRKFYFSCRSSDLKLIFLVPLDIWKIFLLLFNFLQNLHTST